MFRLLLLLLIIAFGESQKISSEITCNDVNNLGGIFAKEVLKYLRRTSKSFVDEDDFPVNFIVTTDKNKNLMHVNPDDWSWLKDSWDMYQKTYVIVHGFKSSGEKPWVVELAKKLVELKKGNVVIVDWRRGCNMNNYINAAKNTQLTSRKTGKFFDRMRRELLELDDSAANTLYNHIHFIGHSLGAQISAQISFALKSSNFWQIERITGLDPANPCFSKDIVSYLRLDKSDAGFVDIIHTQVGFGKGLNGLGIRDPIGHTDFYVNSGVLQPKCLGSFFTTKLQSMICSHKLVTKYFIQSLNMRKNDTCAFRGYDWDGTFLSAQDSLAKKLKGTICSECPEMGINADQNKREGIYLVITGEDEPFCKIESKDSNDIVSILWKFKGTTPIFEV